MHNMLHMDLYIPGTGTYVRFPSSVVACYCIMIMTTHHHPSFFTIHNNKPTMMPVPVCVCTLVLLACICQCRSMSVARQQSPEAMKKSAQNVFAICGHLQNPDLYSTSWADLVLPCDQNGLVAARDVAEGEIVSLIPVHAVGLKGLGSTDQHDVMIFDDALDGDFFRTSKRSTYQQLVPEATTFNNKLFIDINPARPRLPGWIGHLVSTSDDYENCKIVPFVPPLCALLSTRPITKNQVLFQGTKSISPDHIAGMQKRYQGEIAELESYLRMAQPQQGQGAGEAASEQAVSTPAMPFHAINREYPGMKTLRSDPDILEVENFLTDEECDRLIAKAQPNLLPCVTKNPRTGAVEVDPDRTSTNANIPQAEVPTIVSKILRLASCKADQLEIFQVLHYSEGQEFNVHTDGFRGPTTACGFEDSGRLVTIFCYLNDVEEGGETRFSELGLDVKPSKGKAVIHFPATTGLEEDPRTEHEGVAAVDDKWLLVTWVWMHSRSDATYAESQLACLSGDII
jgi:prolyl 4-hydroxylase